MEDTRPAKRTRQACDPCRRKKTRCPGEKPVCSYCHRLGQKCEYNDNGQDAGSIGSNRKMEERMDNLEGKLDQVLEQLLPALTQSRQYQSPTQVPRPGINTTAETSRTLNRRDSRRRKDSIYDTEYQRRPLHASIGAAASPEDLMLQDTDINEAGRLYLTWCHNQPISLFDNDTFLVTLRSRDSELLLSLQALCLRFPPGSLTSTRREKLRAISRRSRIQAMERVDNCKVELSTLQTLCLLSLVDLSDGYPVQAGINLAIAGNLARSVPAGHALGDPLEFTNCKKSISVLQHLHGSILSSTPLADSILTDWQFSAAHICRGSRQATSVSTASHGSDHSSRGPDIQILTFTSQLSEVWHLVRIYAATSVGSDAPPPWSPLSDYSFVTQRHLEIDCRVPLQYRFAANKFGEQELEALQGRREYWGPWLFLQIMYAAIPCLLNHPFLLSLRLRNFRDTMPQSFIHQSFELITRHAGWITYFIELLEKKGFQLSDPCLAHCVVVVATIHLQHSFVHDQMLREKAQAGFDKCVNFLRGMGSVWPHISVMANNLEKLQQSVSLVPSSRQTNGLSVGAGQNHSIDVELLRNILTYETAGQPDGLSDRSMFGSSLTAVAPLEQGHDIGAAEYDLVGSAGISGHRTVPQETPVYPPEDVGTTQVVVETTFPSISETGWSVADRYFDGVAVQSDYEGMGFEAVDFGRAIDGWMSLDLG